jgi:tetratricopeptide (TPR) repeat protein
VEASGQTDRALEILGGGLTAMPSDRRLLAEVARLKLAAGDVETAMAQAEKAPGGALGLAEELMRGNAHDAAIEVCTRLEQLGKGSAQVTLVKALAYENSARTDEALAAYAHAMTQDPSDWSAANNRGLLLLEEYPEDATKVAEAKQNLDEAVRRAGGKVADPLLNLALWYGRTERWSEGISTAQQVVHHPNAGALKEHAQKMVESMQKAAKGA